MEGLFALEDVFCVASDKSRLQMDGQVQTGYLS